MIDPSKLPRGGMPPGPFNPFAFLAVRDPRIRIAMLFILLVVVIAAMVLLGRYSKNPAAQQVATAPSIEVVPEVFSGVPALDLSKAERLTDNGPEARKRWPEEAIAYLLLEASNTPAVYSYDKNLIPLNAGSAAEIEKDSRLWRFKFVMFRGEIESKIAEEEYEAGPDHSLRVWRGRVRIEDGANPLHVCFITARAPEYADTNEAGPLVTELIEDGWVRGRGIFVQNYVDGDVPALLVVATEIERDFETLPVKSLDDIPFGIIEDDPAIANEDGGRATLSKEYPRALFRLVEYASQCAGAEGAARREARDLKPEGIRDPRAWEALVGDPKASRGKYFGGLGVIPLEPLRYVKETSTPNDAGVEEYVNGWIYTDQRTLLQFIAPASLPDLPKGSRVRWEGFFYKTKLYAANNGTERLAPMFVLTVLEDIKPPSTRSLFPVTLAGSIVVAMGLLAWIVLKEDGTKENYRRIRQRRIAANRATGSS